MLCDKSINDTGIKRQGMQLQIRNKTTYNSDSKGWLNTEQIPVQLETLCVLVPLFL